MIGAYNPKGELLRQGNLGTIKRFLEELHPNGYWSHTEHNGIKAFWRFSYMYETPKGFIMNCETMKARETAKETE